MSQTLYKLELTAQQVEEVEALAFTGFEIDVFAGLGRDQWVAIGHMCLGKAQRIEAGEYGEPEDEMDDNAEWAEELRGVAEIIFGEFQSGDGKL